MPLKKHPTDPDKMVYVKAEYNLPKPWVGLTDEEIDGLHNEIKVRLMRTFDTKDIYRVIDAKLKEKNT